MNYWVYLGEQYVNSSTLLDVTFLVEGKCFYAHRIALLASSDAFRAMFDGGDWEKDARDIEIPNIRLEVFELMNLSVVPSSSHDTEGSDDRLRSLLISRKIFYELHISIFLRVLNAYVNMPLHKHSLLIQQITPEIRNYFGLYSWSISAPNIYFQRGASRGAHIDSCVLTTSTGNARQGVLDIKVKIMLDWDPKGKQDPMTPLPDHVTIHAPKEEELIQPPVLPLEI
ncbi:uncharacterized protein LOC135671125 [Musa acuminata AAA Group]|uniref:uncharacterized protein LOC135671125 n=1 Tax=Musa acuminata AAA Group TaxID=214697 RepID=UPI0031D56DEF